MTPPSSAAARSLPAPITTLRRLPPLPGHALSWPTGPEPPAVQGTLALDTDLPVPPEATPHLVAVPDRREAPGAAEPTADAEHAMRARAARFTMAVVEAVTGDRPVGQLVRWTTPTVYDELAEHAATVGLATDAETRARTERPRLVSLRVSRPTDDVAEVSGHVRHGARSRALALRLETHLDRWVCTALQLG